MKKVMIISSMLFLGMMLNNVMAQSTDDLRKERERQRVERSLKQACDDDDQYMTEIGYATSKDRDAAEADALVNCQRKLKLRLEQTVKGVVEDMSAKQELISTDAYDAITLRKINQGFQSVINKSISRTIKCYSDSWQNDKEQWEAEYNAKISVDEFIRESKAAIKEDAFLRANVQMDNFEKEFREHLKNDQGNGNN
jgi:hypothetical protein